MVPLFWLLCCWARLRCNAMLWSWHQLRLTRAFCTPNRHWHEMHSQRCQSLMMQRTTTNASAHCHRSMGNNSSDDSRKLCTVCANRCKCLGRWMRIRCQMHLLSFFTRLKFLIGMTIEILFLKQWPKIDFHKSIGNKCNSFHFNGTELNVMAHKWAISHVQTELHSPLNLND